MAGRGEFKTTSSFKKYDQCVPEERMFKKDGQR